EYTAAQTTLAANRSGLAEVMEKEAELEGQRIETEAQLDAARSRIRLLLATASTVLGVDEQDLLKLCDPTPHESGEHHHQGPATQPAPAWREIDVVEVRATRAGLVDRLELTNGSWATSGSLVLSTIEPDKLRFRAQGMQSDLGRLKDGLPALIVPPKSGSISLQDTMEGNLRIGLTADSQERTLDLLVVPQKMAAWARPGVSAHLEITAAGGQNEMAIPLSSVIQDGLAKIIFRRDPQNPDKAIRMEADLGVDDGRWVVINSGVREGDEVVLDGVYQLMIATSGSVEKGGHFHSDGTFHAGEDEE
ncbi:MAG: efflux RND transporter periplasmic adaptor subunit, partial [Phycisphaerae bacterium]